MPTEINFNDSIGIIALAKPSSTHELDCDKILGTGFVVNSEKGIILTCDHVLPPQDRETKQTFVFCTRSRTSSKWNVYEIKNDSAIQWENKDIIALTVQNPSNLKAIKISTKSPSLTDKVIIVGLPSDQLKPENNAVTVRALTGFIVSSYEHECEIDTPLIKTMSGSPVLLNGAVIGIAHKNIKYGLEQSTVYEEKIISNGQIKETHTYKYEEVLRFGVFYKASSWHDWLTKKIANLN